MFITIGNKKPYLQSNKELYEYCKKTTQNSFQKICKTHDLEKNKKIKNNLFVNDIDINNINDIDGTNNKKPNNFFYVFLSILSITSFGYYFYKKNKS